MRNYKFRGKRTDSGEWVHFNFYGAYVDENGSEIDPKRFIRDCGFKVVPETVGQFTGSKDKLGTEIYENHIVKQTYHKVAGPYDDEETFSGHHIGKVVITSSKGVCMKNPLNYSDEADEVTISKQYKSVSGRRCEVIGDIHSNPELLEANL